MQHQVQETTSGCSQLIDDQLANTDHHAVPALTATQEAYAQDEAFAHSAISPG
jgi:hypothetical protein